MDSEFKFGKMEQSTKATGLTIWLMVMENSGTLMEISMTANGNTIKLMDSASTLTQTEQDMKVIG